MIRNEKDAYYDGKKRKKGRVVDEGDYQEPEYITISVTEPKTVMSGGKPQFTTYLISTETTFPEYKDREFSTRRRYSEFVTLRAILKKRMEENPRGRKKGGTIPELPGNTFGSLFGSGRYDPEFIENRRVALQAFLNSVANHVICRFAPELHTFLRGE